jgi:ferrous iron transport protein A
MMPLSMVSTGETVEVAAVRAGWGLQRRLADLGLTPGVRVRVISSGKPGPVVLNVRGSRLALGYGVAHKIMVKVGGQNK